MINIDKYIKNTTIKEVFKENYKLIETFEDIDCFIYNIQMNKKLYNLLFSNHSLKNYMYSKLDEYCIEYNYINCNSSIERFFNDIQNDGIKIFDNINNCQNEDIIKIIKNTAGVIIC